jgi:hypothetical protein
MNDDMRLPITNYYIASSHNTYLEGDQWMSPSSVKRYIDDLQQGIRCVEIDAWVSTYADSIVLLHYYYIIECVGWSRRRADRFTWSNIN